MTRCSCIFLSPAGARWKGLGKRTYDEFAADWVVQSVVLHQLLVLGEAVKRLSDDFRAAHPDMPWHKMAGMRDVLIHGYDTVDLHAVWRTVQGDLPKLVDFLKPLIPGHD